MTVLADRVALVTGGSAGIGAGLAVMLAAEGAKVVLAARRERELAGVADGIRRRGGVAIPVLTDLTSDESIARLLATAQAEAGPVDVPVKRWRVVLGRRANVRIFAGACRLSASSIGR